MTLTDKEERAMASPANVGAEITRDDLIRLTGWMASGGWHDAHDLADAVEKPWQWWWAIEALRVGREPEVEE